VLAAGQVAEVGWDDVWVQRFALIVALG